MGKVIAIVGTRFTHLHSAKWEKRIFEFIDSLDPETEIVSNGAPGTDVTAISYARAHGIKVRMVSTNYQTNAVDTPEDLKKVELLISQR